MVDLSRAEQRVHWGTGYNRTMRQLAVFVTEKEGETARYPPERAIVSSSMLPPCFFKCTTAVASVSAVNVVSVPSPPSSHSTPLFGSGLIALRTGCFEWGGCCVLFLFLVGECDALATLASAAAFAFRGFDCRFSTFGGAAAAAAVLATLLLRRTMLCNSTAFNLARSVL